MRLYGALFLFLISMGVARAELLFSPADVYNGGVAVLRWHGQPLSFGVVRFMDKIFYFYPESPGAIVLLPIGLDVQEGDYPLRIALLDRNGRTIAQDLFLSVKNVERPVEELILDERMVSPDAKTMLRIERESQILNEVFSAETPRLWTYFKRPVIHDISSVFGIPRVLNGKKKSIHGGTDFRTPLASPVKSISDGRVAMVADLYYTGQTVVVDHGEGLFSLYAHLSEILVSEGDVLFLGDSVGKAGSTGRSTGPHLHLTVKLLGERIDPMALINALGD